jgi:hypothetical protein
VKARCESDGWDAGDDTFDDWSAGTQASQSFTSKTSTVTAVPSKKVVSDGWGDDTFGDDFPAHSSSGVGGTTSSGWDEPFDSVAVKHKAVGSLQQPALSAEERRAQLERKREERRKALAASKATAPSPVPAPAPPATSTSPLSHSSPPPAASTKVKTSPTSFADSDMRRPAGMSLKKAGVATTAPANTQEQKPAVKKLSAPAATTDGWDDF